MSEIENILDRSLENTVSKPPNVDTIGANFFTYLARAGLSMYPWWSVARDIQLANFWKQVDYLSGAIYTLESKMSSIPVRIQARDQSIKEDVIEAERETERFLMGAEFGAGWTSFYEKFVEALVTQDNGAFAEIIGAGRADGPIVGRPITVRTLDPALCQRTGDPKYPILFHDPKGSLSKIHFTRVMFKSQMESTINQMFGVGFCGISRAINTAQSLLDILIYKQEKLGSRPHRGIMVAGGGLDPEDISVAFRMVESINDNQALSRYSKIAVVGDSSLPDAKITLTDLSSLPDGFDERTNVELGMAVIAMAFGMDARELFPALQSGATRADALIQHLKQRGKGPGQIIQMTEMMFNAKYLPPNLKMVFDFQDDEEDRQSAETKDVRSRRWATSIKSGSMDTHTARAQMVEVGDLERGQFERLELEDGRLEDGTTVLALFYSDDQKISKYLKLSVKNPLDTESNTWETLKEPIEKNIAEAMSVIVNSKIPEERWAAQKALSALKALTKLYNPEPIAEIQPQTGGEDGTTKPDPRRRKIDLLRPEAPKIEVDELEGDQDDGLKEGHENSAMIAFYVPIETANQLISGIKEATPIDELHMTLSYLGKINEYGDQTKKKVQSAIEELASTMPPIQANITGVATFLEENDGKNPVVALVDSPDLPAFRTAVMKAISKAGMAIPRDHGFIPHITLAYVNHPIDVDIDSIEILFDELTLVWGGERLIIPLRGKPRDLIEGKGVGNLPSHPF